jgi:hypothetical protein
VYSKVLPAYLLIAGEERSVRLSGRSASALWMLLQEVIALCAFGFAIGLGRLRNHVHFAVTAHPSGPFNNCVKPFPGTPPRHQLSDRDRIFGADFVDQVKAMGIQQVLSAPRPPWQRG